MQTLETKQQRRRQDHRQQQQQLRLRRRGWASRVGGGSLQTLHDARALSSRQPHGLLFARPSISTNHHSPSRRRQTPTSHAMEAMARLLPISRSLPASVTPRCLQASGFSHIDVRVGHHYRTCCRPASELDRSRRSLLGLHTFRDPRSTLALRGRHTNPTFPTLLRSVQGHLRRVVTS